MNPPTVLTRPSPRLLHRPFIAANATIACGGLPYQAKGPIDLPLSFARWEQRVLRGTERLLADCASITQPVLRLCAPVILAGAPCRQAVGTEYTLWAGDASFRRRVYITRRSTWSSRRFHRIGGPIHARAINL